MINLKQIRASFLHTEEARYQFLINQSNLKTRFMDFTVIIWR